MYRQLANYYDEIYYFKNYQKETDKIETIIQRHKKSSGNKLLDVACGTGNHIQYLKQHYSVEGLDSSPEMLRIARKKHPEVVFHRGDMTSFKKGLVGFNYVDKPNLKIARINISRVRGPVSAFEYHFLIGTPSKVQYIIDKESMGLWTHEEYLD